MKNERSNEVRYAQTVCSNNYLKMHRIPMRRKMRGTRRSKRYFYMDEMSLMYRVSDTEQFFQNLYKRARSFCGSKTVSAVSQKRSPEE